MDHRVKGKVQVCAYIPEEVVRDVKVNLAYLNMKLSAYVTEALLDRLEKDNAKVEALKD